VRGVGLGQMGFGPADFGSCGHEWMNLHFVSRQETGIQPGT